MNVAARMTRATVSLAGTLEMTPVAMLEEAIPDRMRVWGWMRGVGRRQGTTRVKTFPKGKTAAIVSAPKILFVIKGMSGEWTVADSPVKKTSNVITSPALKGCAAKV